jgi:uncharacterized protein (DUF1800 family)
MSAKANLLTISRRKPERPSGSWRLAATSLALLLAACGGGGGGDNASSAAAAAQPAAVAGVAGVAAAVAGSSTPAKALAVNRNADGPADLPANSAEAARFLTQATFGPTDADVTRLMTLGYSAWLDEQLSLPATSHRAYWEAANAVLQAQPTPTSAGQDQVWESFWLQSVNGPDQLRLRVAYALSQIFVISALDSNVGAQPRALAAWLDMLGTDGLTNYRQLLESVSLHPLMGLYLTSLHNQKADPATGRVPDENYAREVMQLFSIGLVKLNIDGTPALVNGAPVETYTPADIAGLAKVFTGWSWACPLTNSGCFNNGVSGTQQDLDRAIKPMKAYPQYHSTDTKAFLGFVVGAQRAADPAASLRLALNVLARHTNTAPFISKQLIQRLVTSNPSPAYVADVATAFSRNEGDMKIVIKAIFMHPEARLAASPQGKLREPVLRLSAYLRAMPHTSLTGGWKVGNTDSASTSLGQTPLRAPSVFNFYRPGYVAPGTLSAAAGLLAPEMQLLNESSASGWTNFMRDNLTSGVGQFQATVNGVTVNMRDMQRDWTPELGLAATPAALVSSVVGRLLYGQASAALQSEIVTAISTITIPALAANGSNLATVNAAKFNRVKSAVLLTLASPDFLVQK